MKLLALDMDGTLLNREGRISKRNTEAIFHLQRKGVQVVIATGRHFEDAMNILSEAGISCPVISLNGADIRLQNGKPIWRQPIEKKDVQHIVTSAAEINAYLEIYCDDHIYTTFAGKKALYDEIEALTDDQPNGTRERLEESVRQQFLQARVKQIESFENILLEKEVYKILFFALHNKKKVDFLSSLKSLRGIFVTSSAKLNVEVNEIRCHKGFGLQKVAGYYRIPLQQTVCMGDNYNDLPMFRMAGSSVAMGNADDTIKNSADYVTDTNDRDGVAKAIYNLWGE
jgi:Cof subfamily protein (haloacid dehalogenase superfamily)